MKHLFILKRRLLGLLSLTALFVLISTMGAYATVQRGYKNNHGDSKTMSYATVCQALQGGTPSGFSSWNNKVLTVVNATTESTSSSIPSDFTVQVKDGVTWTINTNVTVTNNGTINNYGIITNDGTLDNYNTISNIGGTINNNSSFTNYIKAQITNSYDTSNAQSSSIVNSKTFTNNEGGTITNDEKCTITNDETLINSGTINNSGAISNTKSLTNLESGTINNNNSGTIENTKFIYNYGELTNGEDAKITNYDNIQNSGTLTNYGTFIAEKDSKLYTMTNSILVLNKPITYTDNAFTVYKAGCKVYEKTGSYIGDAKSETENFMIQLNTGTMTEFKDSLALDENSEAFVHNYEMDKTYHPKTFTVAKGATLDIGDGVEDVDDMVVGFNAFNVNGTVNVADKGSLRFKDTGALLVSASGSITVQNGGRLTFNASETIDPSIEGTITVQKGGTYTDLRKESTWVGKGTIVYEAGSTGNLQKVTYIGGEDAKVYLKTGTIDLYSIEKFMPVDGTLEKTERVFKGGALVLNGTAVATDLTTGPDQYIALDGESLLEINSCTSLGSYIWAKEKAKIDVLADGTFTLDKATQFALDGQMDVNGTYTLTDATECIDGTLTVKKDGIFQDNRTGTNLHNWQGVGAIVYETGAKGNIDKIKIGTNKDVTNTDYTLNVINNKIELRSPDYDYTDKPATGTYITGGKYTGGIVTIMGTVYANNFTTEEGSLLVVDKDAILYGNNKQTLTNTDELWVKEGGTIEILGDKDEYGTFTNNNQMHIDGLLLLDGDETSGAKFYDLTNLTEVGTKGILRIKAGAYQYYRVDNNDVLVTGPNKTYARLELIKGTTEWTYKKIYTLKQGSDATSNGFGIGDYYWDTFIVENDATVTVGTDQALTNFTVNAKLYVNEEAKIVVPGGSAYEVTDNGLQRIDGTVTIHGDDTPDADKPVGTYYDYREIRGFTGNGRILVQSGGIVDLGGDEPYLDGPLADDHNSGAAWYISDSDGSVEFYTGGVMKANEGTQLVSNSLVLGSEKLYYEEVAKAYIEDENGMGKATDCKIILKLGRGANITIPDNKTLTVADNDDVIQLILPEANDNFVSQIILQGLLKVINDENSDNPIVMNFTASDQFDYTDDGRKLTLNACPEIATVNDAATVNMPIVQSPLSSSIVWREGTTAKDYEPGTIVKPSTTPETYTALIATNGMSLNIITTDAYKDIYYGQYNTVRYTITNGKTNDAEPETVASTLRNIKAKIYSDKACTQTSHDFVLSTIPEPSLIEGGTTTFAVTTLHAIDGAIMNLLAYGNYYGYIEVTAEDAQGNALSDTIVIKQVVLKNTPVITDLAATSLTYGQTLSESKVTGTATPQAATYPYALDTPVTGSYAFTDPTIIPDVTDYEYEVTFTPADGMNYASVTGEKASVTVDPKDIADKDVILADISAQPFTDTFVTPALSITYKGMTLEENKDYVVKFENNVDLGTATVTIAGMGNYTGERTATFTIADSGLLYKITIPETDGITTDPVSGTYYKFLGDTFSFTATVDPKAEGELVVTDGEGAIYTPDEEGVYTVKIDHGINFVFTGITTGTEALSQVNIWAVSRMIHIYTPTNNQAMVITMNGKLYSTTRLAAGNNLIRVDEPGVYIVTLASGETAKFLIK